MKKFTLTLREDREISGRLTRQSRSSSDKKKLVTTGVDAIKIATTIYAPVRKVWEAWTDPVYMLTWIGSDPNGKGLKAAMDVQPGGAYEISFCNSDGDEHTCHGIYIEIEKFSKLAFSWEWKSEPGVESFVTVQLIADEDHTRILFKHSHVGNASAHYYEYGWKGAFSKLEKLLNPYKLN